MTGWDTAATRTPLRKARTAFDTRVVRPVSASTCGLRPDQDVDEGRPGGGTGGNVDPRSIEAPDGRTTSDASVPRISIVEAAVEAEKTAQRAHVVAVEERVHVPWAAPTSPLKTLEVTGGHDGPRGPGEGLTRLQSRRRTRCSDRDRR